VSWRSHHPDAISDFTDEVPPPVYSGIPLSSAAPGRKDVRALQAAPVAPSGVW
jgi:hypothetical protein